MAISNKGLAVGRFLSAEFMSVAKVYFAPVTAVFSGHPVEHFKQSWAERDKSREENWNRLLVDFQR